MTDTGGYIKESRIIDLKKANRMALIVVIPIVALYVLPYYLLWGSQSSIQYFKTHSLGSFLNAIVILFAIVGGIIVHELIHGITWAQFTTHGFKSMKFGILWKTLTPYCHCKEPLTAKHYVLGAAMPSIVLGFLPAIFAIIFGNPVLLVFGAFFTMAAIGDFMIIHLLRNEKANSLVEDHPTEGGCYVYRKP